MKEIELLAPAGSFEKAKIAFLYGLSAGEGNRLQIVLADEVSAGVVGSDSHKEEIKELIAKKTGKEVDIDVKCLEQGRRFEDSFVDIESMIHMDITIED